MKLLRFVKILCQAVIFYGCFTHSALAQRGIATLDWTVAETLLALGETPVAVGDKLSYQKWVAEPPLPENVLDLGIRLQPNLEQIVLLSQRLEAQPLWFINSGFYQQTTPLLQKYAKQVFLVDFYRQGNTWENVLNATRQIATHIDKPSAFERLMQQYQQKIAQIRPLVQAYQNRPIVLVQFIDSRHLRIYAENSLFGAVLAQLGFRNAWQGEHNSWGFASIEVTQLSRLPADSRFVVIKPYPANIRAALQYNSLWQKLAMAQDPLILPSIWTFGGVPSAQRFAEQFAHALINGGEKW